MIYSSKTCPPWLVTLHPSLVVDERVMKRKYNPETTYNQVHVGINRSNMDYIRLEFVHFLAIESTHFDQ